ncbi:hypothetical protein LUZ60_009880 [Juncus effusus]|nr:hypothetical protein LUZ60_009880 [Juncus effusus]
MARFLPSLRLLLRARTVHSPALPRLCGSYIQQINGASFIPTIQGLRFYARDPRNYNLFGSSRLPGSEEFRKAWAQEVNEEDCLWTGSEDDEDEDPNSSSNKTDLEKQIKKIKQKAKENSNLIDGDDSDELRSICPSSEDEMNLWSGSECDDSDDVASEAYPNEKSDKYIDKVFEFDESPKYRTLSEVLKEEDEPPELSPGKQARKLAVENALKKLKKGPDGRYTNVYEVMTDLDVLIGAFENIVSGPEYAELREGGPKKLNMEFFKDIQAKMRDPGFRFSKEVKLRPKSKVVSKKKWQRAQATKRRNEKR